MAAATDQLSAGQSHALLDVLSHYEVYQEILDFRNCGALEGYGPPFEDNLKTPSTSPSLQTLVAKFVLNLPGLRDVSDEFWRQRVLSIINRLEEAELSESYDKGNIGIRKTLATATSALIEYLVRGVFAGFDEPSEEDLNRQYELSNSEDISKAFRDLMHQSVYGHVIDDIVQKIGETDKLSEHTMLIQAAHEYIVVNLASFLHYALIISPKGQNLLSLIDHANKLVPYTIIKQTLRIGNVASMISAMTKVVLAKVSVSSLTNWMGWTQNADEGMNLMQHIISQVLNWDIRDLKHRASKIEKEKQGPSKEQLQTLKEYLQLSREQHQSMREISKANSQSIVFVILTHLSASAELSESQHKLAQDYLAIQLSIRDREQIIQVLCHSQPDHLSDAVRDLVATYEPVIRHLHNAVDLSETINDFEVWLRDTIKLAKMSDAKSHHLGRSHHQTPTVGDFVHLLKKHQSSCHRFLHQVVKNGKEITSWFHEYALQAASQFRRKSTAPPEPQPNAGDLAAPLKELFTSLPADQQDELAPLLDHHAAYLSKLHAASAARLHAVVTSPPSRHPALANPNQAASQPNSRSSSPAPTHARAAAGIDANPGPGAFLARWQDLIDNTPITPDAAEGAPVRSGAKGSVLKASRVGPGPPPSVLSQQSTLSQNSTASQQSAASGQTTAAGDADDDEDEDVFEEAHERLDLLALREDEKISRADMTPVAEALGPAFREMMAKRTAASAG